MTWKFAALSDWVYHRQGTNGGTDGDQAITLEDIGDSQTSFSTFDKISEVPGTSQSLEQRAAEFGFQMSDDGFFYNDATGFVGSIVEEGGNLTIVYRGTDAGNATFLGDVLPSLINFGGDPDDIDTNDMSNNAALGGGTTSPTGQHIDAINLAKLALELVNNDASKISVTGQSLGGGLAGLAGAYFGFDTHLFAPAPFKKQLGEFARMDAVSHEDLSGYTGTTNTTLTLAEYLKPEFWSNISDTVRIDLLDNGTYTGVESPVTLFIEEYFDPSITDQAAAKIELRAHFDTRSAELKALYEGRTANFSVNTVKGEVLSSGISGTALSALSEHFKAPDYYDLGQGTATGSLVGFHSPSLHALAAILEQSNGSNPLENLLQSDAQLRYLLVEDIAAAGAIGSNRTDLISGSSSDIELGYADVGILFRALWKSARHDPELWNYFNTLYSDVTSGGAAAEGIQANSQVYTGASTDPVNVHGGVLKLSLSVLRDAIQSTQTLAQIKQNLDNSYAFAGSDANGVNPRSDRVIVNLSQIEQVDRADHDGDHPFREQSGRPLGVADIDAKIISSAAVGIFGEVPEIFTLANRGNTAEYLGTDYSGVIARLEALKPWEVLVVQGGAAESAWTHNAITDDPGEDGVGALADKPHVIIGGNNTNDITGSNANDYILGGTADDVFHQTGGADIIVGGGGNDKFVAVDGQLPDTTTTFIANAIGGDDIADYSALQEPVLVRGFLEEVGNETVEAYKVGIASDLTPDIHFGVNRYIGTDQSGDTADFSGSDNSIYLGPDQTGNGTFQVYANYEESIYQNYTIIGIDRGTVVKEGKGFFDPIVTFENFEHVIGTSSNDVLAVHDTSGADATITIYGGGGDDVLYAGKTQAILKGGDGNDTILTNGKLSSVYGGAGVDRFEVGPNAFVKDATDYESIQFGAFNLTGGVQFQWQEGAFAYWQPFSAILQGIGTTIAGQFAEFWTVFSMDIQFMSWMRYAQTDSGQLIAQMGRGYGEIVIENYDLNLETGLGTGGITVFSVDNTEASAGSLSEFKRFIDLAIQQGFGGRFGGYDPLVIDLDKDGLDLTRQNQREVYFDLDGDGFGERTGWVREDDGLLAVDLNNDGNINDISELFGNQTTSGLTALSAYDSNGDGVINSLDTLFSDLLIWRDLDQDGETDAGELSDLSTHGIVEISLTGRDADLAIIGGNDVREVADVTFSDGSTSIAGDVWFDANQVDSKYQGDTTVSSAAAALPSIRGFGDMASLQVVMTSNATLLTMVSDFTALPASTDWAGYQAAASDILLHWTGVEGVAATALGNNGFDLQKLAYLETASGLQLAPRDENTGEVLDTNADELLDVWHEAVANHTARLLFQSQFASYLDGITYDETQDIFVADASNSTALADTFDNFLTTLPTDAAAAEVLWDSTFAPAIAAAVTIMERHDGIKMRTDFVTGQLVLAHDASVHALSLDQLVSGLGYDNVIVSGPLDRANAEGMVVYVGTSSDDTFTGGDAQDVYVFDSVIGNDVIVDAETGHTPHGDRLRFVHLNEDDVDISRDGVDLVVTVTATGETVRVQNQFLTPEYNQAGRQISQNWGIEDIQFADGTIFEAIDIGAAVNMGSDTTADHIIGTSFDDEINGGLMDDVLEGGDGGDFYVYQAGGGHDIIRDLRLDPFNDRQDLLMLTGGLSLEDMRFERIDDSDDLTIRFSDDPNDTNSIFIEGQFGYSYLGYDNEYALDQRIEGFGSLEDAPVNWVDIQQRVIETYTTSGDDITYGFGTSDLFEASAGNDWLSGGDSGDLYLFGFGSDHDTIEDNQIFQTLSFNTLPGSENLAGEDSVLFGNGISSSDVHFSRVEDTQDLLIEIFEDPNSSTASDSLLIKDQFNGQRLDLFDIYGVSWFDRIENFLFENGTTLTWEDVLTTVTTGDAGDNVLVGDHYADTLTGNGGNDHLSGGDDGDIYVYNLGDGNDVIEDNQYDIFSTADDKLQFGAGITSSDVSFSFGPTDQDVLITLTDGSTITLIGQLSGIDSGIFGINWKNRIETLEFIDAQGQVLESISWDAIMSTLVSQQQSAGDDTINGIDSDFAAWGDTIDGGAGNDTILAHGGNDTISGGTGDDIIDGGWGNDTYVFNPGDGVDTIEDTGSGLDNADKLVIGYNSADVTVTRVSGTNDIVLTFANSSDHITVINALTGSKYNSIETYEFLDATWTATGIAQSLVDGQATAGADIITGTGTINGLGGNDLIWGETGNDTLSGDAGDDFLNGSNGTDTYLYSAGDGHDTIHDQGDGLDTNDILKITGYTRAQTTVEVIDGLDQIDLVFTGAGDRISLINPLDNAAFARGINLIEFVDEGVTWDFADISALAIAAQATSGNDEIIGSGVADIIDGGAGDDDINGGAGNDDISGGIGNDHIDGGVEDDTYRFGRGDGQDTITDTGNGLDNNDKLIISDYLPNELSVQRIEGTDNVLITFAGTTDSITLEEPLTGSYINQIDSYEFEADGTIWTPSDLAQQILLREVTTGDDDLQGFDTDDAIAGGAGNDTISGHDGDDILSGDVGDDTLDGGWGNDIYIFNIGDGHDTIVDNGSGLDNNDRLIINGYLAADVTATAIAGTDNVELTFAGTSDKITLLHPLASGVHQTIEHIEFVSGGITTVWDKNDLAMAVAASAPPTGPTVTHLGTTAADTINASSSDDVIDGLTGDDTLSGKGGADTYLYASGDGNDTIDDGNYEVGDILKLTDLNTSDVQLTKAGNDLLIEDLSTGQIITDKWHFYSTPLWGVESIEFADGTIWDYDDINSNAWLRGTSGADTLDGAATVDTLYGALGDDTLRGKGAADTYVYASGDGNDTIDDGNYEIGDVLKLTDLNAGDVQLSKVGNDLLIEDLSTGQIITDKWHFYSTQYWGVESIEFSDGTIWDHSTIAANAWMRGTASADTINGTSSDDYIHGDAGNDTLKGKAGADTYLYASGDGNDTIDDGVYDIGDTLKFTDLNADSIELLKSGSHLIVTDTTTSQTINVQYQFYSAPTWGVESIEFADGSQWDVDTIASIADFGTTSNADTVSGTSSDDLIIGRQGDDALTGLAGADTFVFASGDGADTINDFSLTDGDLIDIAAYGFTSTQNLNNFTFDGSDTIVDFNGTDQITVVGVDLTTQTNPDDSFIFV